MSQSSSFTDNSFPMSASLGASSVQGRILLVGKNAVIPACSELNADHADSLADAIFNISVHPYELIVVAVAGEANLQLHLENLRKAAPDARVLLICDAAEERTCRRVLSAGVDDYEILPLTLDKILRHLPLRTVPQVLVHPSAPVDPVMVSVLQLPIQAHTEMADELLSGVTDISSRAVAILQSAVAWGGTLRYDAGEQIRDKESLSAIVGAHNVIFGRLVLTGASRIGNDIPGTLNQAALWLAGWLNLSRRYEQLRTLAITDELSGAYNRRYFNRFVTSLLDKARVDRFRVSILLFDIDNFKHYNDTFGHAAGDAIVRELIRLLKRCTRQQDLVARLGGDEFAVVFWDHDAPRQPNSQHPADAMAATERFRKAIRECEWSKLANMHGTVSISGGIATFPWDAETLDGLMEKADGALLRAKAQGKNVILLTEPKIPEA